MGVSFFVSGRLFNEKEVSEILKRASVSRSRGEPSGSDGISLEELQQVGAELGYDPKHIELASQQLGTGGSPRGGLPDGRIVLDRTVEGEVSAEDWLGMVAVVQRYHKGSGAITQRGSNYDWAGSEEGGSLALTVNVRNGRSRILLESNRWIGILMAGIFFPVFAFVFSMVLTKRGYPLGAIAVCALFAALMFIFIRLFRQHHLQSVSGLMDRLMDEAQASGVAQPLSMPVGLGETATPEQTVRS